TASFAGQNPEPSHSNLGAATWTCVAPSGDGKRDSGISVDQVIANRLGQATVLPSIQVGLSTLDSYTDGLPGQHSRSMAWKSANEPLYKLVNPQALFDRLTGSATSGDASEDAAAAMKRRALKQSVLDHVRDSTQSLQRKLGVSDRRRLDQFLTSVRSLEQRVAATGMQLPPSAACQKLTRPAATFGVGNVPEDYDRGAHASLMIDLVVMALACDITRVVSFMLDDARSDFVYDFLPMRTFSDSGSEPGTGKAPGYHGAQHAGDKNNGFATIGHWNAQKAAELAGKLQAIADGDAGNMLDNSVITFASGMHGGNHDAADLPVALIGGGGKLASGTVLATDRNIVFEREQPLANVHLTVMQSVFDCPDPKFGSSTGPIAELLRG
ncbi:MAG TPA: DUF1552 domain-containing protein, partial [Polyangiales bacterium]|nr:DUF1552 domain-containing protein [Polyangiales bacterium]